MENNAQTTSTTPNPLDDKLIGILSYLGILWIVAYILYGSKKTEYNLFHVKQGLVLIITWVALWIVSFILAFIPIINIIWGIVAMILYLVIFVVAIIGIINAANGQMKPLIVIGKFADTLLKNFK
jgi:uncharacterized membrane protein